jgi:hypothetical protein
MYGQRPRYQHELQRHAVRLHVSVSSVIFKGMEIERLIESRDKLRNSPTK